MAYTPKALRETQVIPRAALASLETWGAYLQNNRDKLSPEAFKIALSELAPLWHLGKAVSDLGGWLQVTGANKWPEVDSHIERLHSLGGARVVYELCLLPIEKKRELALRYSVQNPLNVSLNSLKFEAIQPIPVLRPPKSGVIDDAFWRELLAMDIAILRGFTTEVWPLSEQAFSLQTIEEVHGDEVFEVLSQNREPDCAATQVHSGKKAPISIRDYIAKMRKEMSSDQEASGQVEFGVNIDIGRWSEQINELRKVMPKRLIFGSISDALDYVRMHVYGMTLPQIYLKVAGCWTGAHQENLSFAAVNVNHGPGACEWWALDPRFNSSLRQEIRERLDFDIYECETLWWPDENYLMSRGLTTYYGDQLPGDIVYVGPSTIHWVKSRTATVNSAWNFGRKDLQQFQVAFQRDTTNRAIAFESIVQIHTLAMDLLNAELLTLPEDLVEFLYEKLKARLAREKEIIKKLNLRKQLEVVQEHQVLRCDKCRQEIFMCYALCSLCESEAFCLSCIHFHNKDHSHYSYFSTFAPEHLEALLLRVERRKDREFAERCACYIPGLNLAFSKAEKYSRIGVFCSPWTGSPDSLVFRSAQSVFQPPDAPSEASPQKRPSSSKPASTRKKRKTESIKRQRKTPEEESKKEESPHGEELAEVVLTPEAKAAGGEDEAGKDPVDYMIPKKRQGVGAIAGY